MASTDRTGTRLMDRPEYRSKPKPLTRGPYVIVAEAVVEMADLNYGSVIVVDKDDMVIGVVTERDIMKKIVGKGRDPKTTKLSEIMTADPRLAREDDDMLDWLRIMSNERFRRLPVVDGEGRIKAVFTQGDFVSYTWPELMGQMRSIVKAQVAGNFHYILIGGAILIYALAMVVVLSVV
ncbi:Inosine-5'-monophosphate dehydrogenase [Jannaschia seosinensis]|uniref:Inosine-5'-monophosphate dehydrogenase n=1 Tax=Jannaschia seosinensis TaxID=313367 RepID=A0A0M7BC28_9RHOB|nr:CBS domain-containing protein [Jannaschia seosinensis]CUH40347.1 Inosine-5'-monophosphate dehydrogenase [Jannaschia seosinensis]